MSIYLYNLGFSTSNALSGNFSVGGSGINASNAWFQYNGPGNPPGLNNYQGVIPSLGAVSSWNPLSAPPANFNSAQTGSGDYLFLRIFNSDGTPGNYLVRTTVIVGQGDSALSPVVSQLQSPFVKNSAYQPMPVIDCDTVSFSGARCSDLAGAGYGHWSDNGGKFVGLLPGPGQRTDQLLYLQCRSVCVRVARERRRKYVCIRN